MQTGQTEQMALIGFVDDAIGKVFAPKAILGKNGVSVGSSVTMRPRKEIATALGIANTKDNKGTLDKAILGMSDDAFRKVKAEIAGLGPDWTLAKVAQRTLGNGVRQISVVVKEIKRNVGPSDEEIAKALGCTVEEVAAMRGRQTAALAAPIEMAPDEKSE